jgi:hypothetical protein
MIQNIKKGCIWNRAAGLVCDDENVWKEGGIKKFPKRGKLQMCETRASHLLDSFRCFVTRRQNGSIRFPSRPLTLLPSSTSTPSVAKTVNVWSSRLREVNRSDNSRLELMPVSWSIDERKPRILDQSRALPRFSVLMA